MHYILCKASGKRSLEETKRERERRSRALACFRPATPALHRFRGAARINKAEHQSVE
jgi:hypothetical protein